MYQSNIARAVLLDISVDTITIAHGLDSPPLRKGPIDVTLRILRSIKALAVGFIERDVLFQPVRQVRVSQEILSVTDQSTSPIRKLHAFLAVISAVAHEDFWSPDFTKELV